MPVSVDYVDKVENPLERGLLFRWPDRTGGPSHE